ncbi:hypothetical protein AAG906_014046 [Vitis piasezkii]
MNARKPKVEVDDRITTEEDGDENSRDEQEEALVALIEHRTKEVEHIRKRITYYQSQLQEAEKKLLDSQAQLGRLRSKDNLVSSRSSVDNGTKKVKVERRSTSPLQLQSRPELLIPAVNPKISQPVKLADAGTRARSPTPNHAHSVGKVKWEKSHGSSSEREMVEVQDKGTKRKFEPKEHKELITSIATSSSPVIVRCYSSSHISSQHKRKLRSLVLCPVNNQLFATSALDGIVNLWQIQARGSGASLLSATDCLSQKQRRWPEDMAWHPEGNSIFSVYNADDGDSQISVLNLNRTKGQGARVTFLEEKPHVKGIINSISFMPWENPCFVTGGSDHAVVLWNEKDEEKLWKPKALHRNMHSSAVMGVAGMQQKQIVLSVGADKRIIGLDLHTGRTDFKHQIDSKCMSIVPNPCDFNLYMVQAGTPGKQLRLFDIRLRQTELHAFGWKQESSDSLSALINQTWSPDGLYITSGSVDPVIHIFDIRSYAHKPSQSIKAHQKRVFKAIWHHSLPLLISISSDLNIGLHKLS